MLRALIFALSLTSFTASAVVAEDRSPYDRLPDPVFPLPKDAKAPQTQKGGMGKIQTYDVPRGRGPVTDELRAALKTGGWEIVKDEPSPSGNATRIQAKSGGKLWKVSVTGDTTRSVIILTVP
jgi:hypothetical protein